MSTMSVTNLNLQNYIELPIGAGHLINIIYMCFPNFPSFNFNPLNPLDTDDCCDKIPYINLLLLTYVSQQNVTETSENTKN